MNTFDAGKAKVVITTLSLKYGNPYYRADGEEWVTERSKLPAITYKVSQVLMKADDIDEIYGSVYLKNKKEAALATAAKRKSTRFLSTEEVKAILGTSRVITKEMFAEYENLECIGIPLGVKEIKADAFASCSKLTDIFFEGTKKEWKAIKTEKEGNKKLLKAKMQFNDEPAKFIWQTYAGENFTI